MCLCAAVVLKARDALEAAVPLTAAGPLPGWDLNGLRALRGWVKALESAGEYS